MMVSDDLARSDVVTRTPVDIREPCDGKFLRDRLAGLHVMRPHMATVKVLIGSLADSRSGALRPYPMPVTLPMVAVPVRLEAATSAARRRDGKPCDEGF